MVPWFLFRRGSSEHRARPKSVRAESAAIALAALTSLLLPARADVIGEARVIDGDTLQIAGERVRLQGIDAPESKQSCSIAGVGWACGEGAKRELMSVTDGRVVTCKGDKRDRYGRLLAICFVGAQDINARMVREGWALAFRRYSKEYVPQEVEARATGAGLWQGQFIDPSEWRRESRAAQH
jgi:endonuclease YncB( thermonuclease family)